MVKGYIKKIKLANDDEYIIRDEEALHDASAFDPKGSAAQALKDANEYTNSKLTAVLRFKGSKSTLTEVQSLTDMVQGDVWLVTADNSEYVYTGSAWEMMGKSYDAASSKHTHSVTVAPSSTTSVYSMNTTGSVTTGSAASLGTGFYTAGTAASYTGHSFTANVPTKIDVAEFNGGSFSRGSFTQGSFTQGDFSGGSFKQGIDSFTANTPTKIDTSKFSKGTLPSFTRGTFSAGSLPSYTQGTKASWSASVSDDGVLSFSWTANGNDTFNAGTLPSHAADTFSAGSLPALNSGFYTAGTPASFIQGTDEFTAASHGDDVFVKPTHAADSFTPASLGEGFYIEGTAASHSAGTFKANTPTKIDTTKFSGGSPTSVTLPTRTQVTGLWKGASATGETGSPE